jgi:aldehyde dehydrogenase (NAD+)/betaine-aldehyde dehydrogenase
MSTVTQTYESLSAEARDLLGDPVNLIDGTWETGEADYAVDSINPATGEQITRVQAASVEQTERAVAAARRAFDRGPWWTTVPAERAELLLELAGLMDRHRAELAEIVVSEVGCPISLTRAMQVGMPIDNIAWSAEQARKGPQGGYEQVLPPHLGTPPSMSMLVREPVGVVGAITGYNFPINSVVWKLGPGLAAGCTLVIKPSERTPLSSIALVRLAERAGFPKGTVNLIFGGPEVGGVLCTNPDVDMVMFTGSLSVGRKIMQAAASTTKKLVLELGGKSANVVLPDASIDEIVGPTILRWVRNAGQGCGATTRTFVPRAEYDRFAAASEQFLATVAVGDPRDETTAVGPLIREEQRRFVEGFVERALDSGATLVAGGGRPDAFPDGFYLNPAIVGNVGNDAEICREELFGPVGAILPYETLDDAIEMANDSQYGLHAAVWGPITEALAVSRRLRTGAVSINGGGWMRPEGPWGGFKQSGFGREMGEDGYREFFQVKHLQWPLR